MCGLANRRSKWPTLLSWGPNVAARDLSAGIGRNVSGPVVHAQAWLADRTERARASIRSICDWRCDARARQDALPPNHGVALGNLPGSNIVDEAPRERPRNIRSNSAIGLWFRTEFGDVRGHAALESPSSEVERWRRACAHASRSAFRYRSGRPRRSGVSSGAARSRRTPPLMRPGRENPSRGPRSRHSLRTTHSRPFRPKPAGKAGGCASHQRSCDCVRQTDLLIRYAARGLSRTRHACTHLSGSLMFVAHDLMTTDRGFRRGPPAIATPV